MPFVLRTVQPVFVSRRKLTGPDGRPLVQDNELEAVFNGTLCCAIRQLSSLLENADDVFAGLAKEMAGIAERATALQQRLKRVQEHVDAHDPRLVTVRECLSAIFLSGVIGWWWDSDSAAACGSEARPPLAVETQTDHRFARNEPDFLSVSGSPGILRDLDKTT